MLKQVIIATFAIAAVATSAGAQEARAVHVSLAGIDTHSESGARVILQRIEFAARTVCGPMPAHLERITQYDPCVRSVTQETVSRLNNPFVTALLTRSEPGSQQAQLASAK